MSQYAKARFMKTTLIILLLASAANASDIRMVGGISVDLSPIHEWESDSGKESKRPMAHWKQVKVTKVISAVGTTLTCDATIDGITQRIILRNGPASAASASAAVDKLKTEIDALNKKISAEIARIERLEANTYDSDPDQPVVNRRYVENAKVDLSRVADYRDSLVKKLREAQNVLAKIPSDLAMNTGQKFKDVPIWDCGVKK